jgi:hypothetical protein
MIFKAIIGLLFGMALTFAAAMAVHNMIEYGRREGIVEKKQEDRDE